MVDFMLPPPLNSYLLDINRFKNHSDKRHTLGDILWEENVGFGDDEEERKEIINDVCEATKISPKMLEGYEKGGFELKKLDDIAAKIYNTILSDKRIYQVELESHISDLNFEAGKLTKEGRTKGLEDIVFIYSRITASHGATNTMNYFIRNNIPLDMYELQELENKKHAYDAEKELLQEIEKISGKTIEAFSESDFSDEENEIISNIEQQEEIEKIHDVIHGASGGPSYFFGYSKYILPRNKDDEEKLKKRIEERGAEYDKYSPVMDYLKSLGIIKGTTEELYEQLKNKVDK